MADTLTLPATRFGFVFWYDAHSLESTDRVELHDLGKLHGPAPIVTAGWILREDERGVSVCSEFCGGVVFRNSSFIPRSLVGEVRYLKIPKVRSGRSATAPSLPDPPSNSVPPQ